eukprot:3041438-Prymnesium_polylepis.1
MGQRGRSGLAAALACASMGTSWMQMTTTITTSVRPPPARYLSCRWKSELHSVGSPVMASTASGGKSSREARRTLTRGVVQGER